MRLDKHYQEQGRILAASFFRTKQVKETPIGGQPTVLRTCPIVTGAVPASLALNRSKSTKPKISTPSPGKMPPHLVMPGYSNVAVSSETPMKTVDLETARKQFGAKGPKVRACTAMDVSPSPLHPVLADIGLRTASNHLERPLDKRPGSGSKNRRNSRENVNPRPALRPPTSTKVSSLSEVADAVAPTEPPVCLDGAPVALTEQSVTEEDLTLRVRLQNQDGPSNSNRDTFLSTGHCQPWDTAERSQPFEDMLTLLSRRPMTMIANSIADMFPIDSHIPLGSESCETVVRRVLDLNEQQAKHVSEYDYLRIAFRNTRKRGDSQTRKPYQKQERALLCNIARHVSEEMQDKKYQAYVPREFRQVVTLRWSDSDHFFRDLSRLGFLLYICSNHSDMKMERCLAIDEVDPPAYLYSELLNFMQRNGHPLENLLTHSRIAKEQCKSDEAVEIIPVCRSLSDQNFTDHTLSVTSTWFNVLLHRSKPSKYGIDETQNMADQAAYALDRFERGSPSPYLILAERSSIDPPSTLVRRALKHCGVHDAKHPKPEEIRSCDA
ncbi:MAG: hypothetical protein KVP17_002307 [Porospora cf. gigantea B]|uniref:uncharacterized protein n=1 Tax=Porospora cf. gigantea B TaxID=2853592 RepID=UPI0035719EEF|nr:MAG: hypothetical protein KVP17_002307 [Porospora cf. gigantea B]